MGWGDKRVHSPVLIPLRTFRAVRPMNISKTRRQELYTDLFHEMQRILWSRHQGLELQGGKTVLGSIDPSQLRLNRDTQAMRTFRDALAVADNLFLLRQSRTINPGFS